jgi:hypothetical protein
LGVTLVLIIVAALAGCIVLAVLVATRLARGARNSATRSTQAVAESSAAVKNDLATVHYRKCRSLLSPAERSFFGVLEPIAVDLSLRVFSKVRLADVLYVPRDAPNRQALVNRTLQKHLDFVLCDPSTLAPVLVVELDDASHDLDDRQRRDDFVDAACSAAQLPVLHVRAQRSYAVAAVRAQVAGLLLSTGLGDTAA